MDKHKENLATLLGLSARIALAIQELVIKDKTPKALSVQLLDVFITPSALVGAHFEALRLSKGELLDEPEAKEAVEKAIQAFTDVAIALELANSDKADEVLRSLDLLAEAREIISRHFRTELRQGVIHPASPGPQGQRSNPRDILGELDLNPDAFDR